MRFKNSAAKPGCKNPAKPATAASQDFGGCRCQAFLLAGDPAATDPVCSLAPQRPKVDAILAALNDANSVGAGLVHHGGAPPSDVPLTKPTWLYRPNPS